MAHWKMALPGNRPATVRWFFDPRQRTNRPLGNEFWSRPQDTETLAGHLNSAKQVSILTIPQATHFVHLDRAEKGRATLLSAWLDFLAK